MSSETPYSFILTYVAGLKDNAWGSVSDLHACVGFRGSKKVEKTDLTYCSRYTALTTLGIRQEVEHIIANVFYSTFLNVILLFLELFSHLCVIG